MKNKEGITVEELNNCYCEVNAMYKVNGYPIRSEVKHNLIRENGEVLVLRFKQEEIGVKGSYCFSSTDLYVKGIEKP